MKWLIISKSNMFVMSKSENKMSDSLLSSMNDNLKLI